MGATLVKAEGPFYGSKNSNVYHYGSCSYVDRIKASNLVVFSDAQDAVNHGYRPCSVCHPPLPVSNTASPSPSPTAKPTAIPTATPTSTINPTITPTPTPTDTQTPDPTVTSTTTIDPTQSPTNPPIDNSIDTSPTPITPELTPLAIVVGLLAVSSVALVAKKKLQVKR